LALEPAEDKELDQQEPVDEPDDSPLQKSASKKWSGVKTTLYRDPNTLQQYPIPVNLSPNPTVDRIIRYVDHTGFVGILNIGMSGTGKSTLARMLVHKLHQKKNFVVHWYWRDDIQKMGTEIQNLEKGLNHIMIFDDASFSLDKLKKEQLNEIAQRLTFVRHDVKGSVIVMFNVHYSKGISRFFRNVPFVFLTSVTMSEVQSFQDVYPHARWKLRDFAWHYQNMMFNDQWTFEVDKWNNKSYTYRTDHPFRLALALEGNHVHFTVYLQESCASCNPEYNTKKLLNSQDLVDSIVSKYGKDRARAMIRLYSFARHGMKVIDTKRLSIWHTIAEYDKSNNINWKNVNNILDDQLTKKRRRTYVKAGKVQQDVKDLEDKSADATDADNKLTTEQRELKEEITTAFDEIQTADERIQEKTKTDDSEMGYDPETQDPKDMPYGFENVDKSLDNPTDTY